MPPPQYLFCPSPASTAVQLCRNWPVDCGASGSRTCGEFNTPRRQSGDGGTLGSSGVGVARRGERGVRSLALSSMPGCRPMPGRRTPRQRAGWLCRQLPAPPLPESFRQRRTIAKPISGHASFSDRFAFDGPDASAQAAQASQVSVPSTTASTAKNRPPQARFDLPWPTAHNGRPRFEVAASKPRAAERPPPSPRPRRSEPAKAGFQLASAADTSLRSATRRPIRRRVQG